ncbi:MAG: ketoacyl-ACP synthase III [Planctomycetota bacterium]
MAIGQTFRIVGTGSYLPATCVTADEVDDQLGKPTGWTRGHTGVQHRYRCESPENLVTMAKRSIENALQDASIDWSDVDYVIDCSTSKVRPIPNNASHVQAVFGAEAAGIPCVDLQCTCLGSIVGLHFANALFHAAEYRHIVLVTSERPLAAVNWNEPESASLLGDGAAAMVLRREQVGLPLGYRHETFAEHLPLCRIDGGSHHLPPFEYSKQRDQDYRFTMDGPAVFRVARRLLPPMVQGLLEEMTLCGATDLQVVPHQASPSAVEAVRRVLEVPHERYHVGVHEFGNVAAAGIPLMLDRIRRKGLLQKGERVMLLGTSAGYSQAAMIFEW